MIFLFIVLKFWIVNLGIFCNFLYIIFGNCYSWLLGLGIIGGWDYVIDGGIVWERSWVLKLGIVYGECCDLE